MSDYKTGTVTVTNGDATVTGSGTAWLATIVAGQSFKIAGIDTLYQVASVTSDTALELSSNYAGSSGSGKSYVIARDYTTNLHLAEIPQGAVDWPYRMTQEVIRALDSIIAGYLAVSVAGNSNVTLTSAQSMVAVIEFTGALTGDINVIVPARMKTWIIKNSTTGAYTITFKPLGGTGIVVPQSCQGQYYTDGSTMFSANLPKWRGATLVRTSNQTLTNAVTATIHWQTEENDTAGLCDLGTNDDRFVIPPGVSKVRLNFHGRFGSDSTGNRWGGILKYSGGTLQGGSFFPAALTSEFAIQTAIIDVSAGDYFVAQMYQNSGGDLAADYTAMRFQIEVIE